MSEDKYTVGRIEQLTPSVEDKVMSAGMCIVSAQVVDADFARALERENATLRGHLQTMVRELNHNGGRISEETLTEAERILGEG